MKQGKARCETLAVCASPRVVSVFSFGKSHGKIPHDDWSDVIKLSQSLRAVLRLLGQVMPK